MSAKKDEHWIREQFMKYFDEKDFHILAKDGLMGSHERDIVIADYYNALILVLEAKNWSVEQLINIDASKKYWDVKYLGQKQNPQYQANDALTEVLKIITPEMKNEIAYLSGVVFTNISSMEKDKSQVLKELDRNGVIIWGDWFGDSLKKNYGLEINRVFNSVFGSRNKKSLKGKRKLYDDIVKKIDPKFHKTRMEPSNKDSEMLNLEKLATRVQYGNHRVNGVVGSGKSTFLAIKVKELINKYLDQTMDLLEPGSRILILTMTRTCKSKILKLLEEILDEREISVRDELIQIDVFADLLWREYKILQSKVDSGEASLGKIEPFNKFDCVIIDEFQDFKQNWAPFVYRHVGKLGKEDGLFLLLFDPAQAKPKHIADLFNELDKKLNFSWSGREHYLKKCYRLPEKIGKFALGGYKHYSREQLEDAKDENISRVIMKSLRPEFHDKGGIIEYMPVAIKDMDDEAIDIVELVKSYKNKGFLNKNIAIVIPPHRQGKDDGLELYKKISSFGEDADINCLLLDNPLGEKNKIDNRDKFYFRGDVVSIVTPMRFKGLEISCVICSPSVTQYFVQGETSSAFYQAVTRATDTLIIMGTNEQIVLLKTFEN